MLRVWNLSLLAATFCLTILGTFLTRSGVLESVHAFSDGPIGAYLLTYKTTYGQQIRGLASNADLAAASGIDPTRTSVLVWFVVAPRPLLATATGAYVLAALLVAGWAIWQGGVKEFSDVGWL